MYIANSMSTTKKSFKSMTDELREERKWNHKNAQLKPQKAEKEWKTKIRTKNKSNK